MKVAVYARSLNTLQRSLIDHFFEQLAYYQVKYLLYDQFMEDLKQHYELKLEGVESFTKDEDLAQKHVQALISLGGDGTLLDTLQLVKNSNIPVMGINTGRLGFLANIPKQEIGNALAALKAGQYTTESRGLLEVSSDLNPFQSAPYALNDFVVQKRDFSSMVTVETYLNGVYFNTYWADGVIVATPTGSTGYSLSCGGPLIFPHSGSFVITPVAPHNLTIRPIIISDQSELTLKVTGRDSNFLASLDSRYTTVDKNQEMVLRKAPFVFNLIKLHHQSFIQTIRDKLKWGADSRNE
jgi:NAD+ kinase